MTLLRAQESDMRRVYDLICELENCGDEAMEPDAFAQVYRGNIRCGDIVYLVAEESNAVIGFGSMHVQRLLHHCGLVAEVQELVVAAAHRGKGVGALLLRELEEEALRRGCVQVELCCNRKREASNEFYGRRGYLKSHFKHTKKFGAKETRL